MPPCVNCLLSTFAKSICSNGCPTAGVCNPWSTGQKWPCSWRFVSRGKVHILKGYCQSSVGDQRAYFAELDTCSCGPWINLVMCIWPGSVAWLHTPVLEQGFSKYGSRPHLRSRNVILGWRNKLAWQTDKNACKLYKKIKGRPAVNLFYCLFRGNIVLYAVSCLLGCLPELSNDNNQPSSSYTHDF